MTPVAAMAREAERLEALRSCAIIDTQPEADFDDLVAVAAAVAEAPQACIAFVDETRWWVKAWVGQVPRELPRAGILCADSLATAEPVVVDDVRADPRFALHPALESDRHLRFYAALPLVLDGCLAVGALCLSDRKPRVLRPAQFAALQRVARQIVRLVSFRRQATVLAAAHEALAIGEAQFDDYRAKPIRPDTLRAAVARKARRSGVERSLEAEVGVDAAEITARIGGDWELLTDISRLFVIHAPEMLDALQTAAAAGDGAAMVSAAHALKGSIGNFTQGRPFAVARALEKAAEAGDLPGFRAGVGDLEREVAKLCRVLDDIATKPAEVV